VRLLGASCLFPLLVRGWCITPSQVLSSQPRPPNDQPTTSPIPTNYYYYYYYYYYPSPLHISVYVHVQISRRVTTGTRLPSCSSSFLAVSFNSSRASPQTKWRTRTTWNGQSFLCRSDIVGPQSMIHHLSRNPRPTTTPPYLIISTLGVSADLRPPSPAPTEKEAEAPIAGYRNGFATVPALRRCHQSPAPTPTHVRTLFAEPTRAASGVSEKSNVPRELHT
jgi:hypothetical protein